MNPAPTATTATTAAAQAAFDAADGVEDAEATEAETLHRNVASADDRRRVAAIRGDHAQVCAWYWDKP
jgi:hypothetical protein